MTTSTDAILAYGYNLGGDEDTWQVREAGEYGELPALDWLDEDDFQAAAERRLLAEVAGFTEEWQAGVDGYFERRRAAEARLGVQFETYCSGSYPMFILAAHVTTVRRGACEEVDPLDLQQRPEQQAWDAKLDAAVKALGLTPTQERPRWLLCSYWG
jgi:hypothetical protein